MRCLILNDTWSAQDLDPGALFFAFPPAARRKGHVLAGDELDAPKQQSVSRHFAAQQLARLTQDGTKTNSQIGLRLQSDRATARRADRSEAAVGRWWEQLSKCQRQRVSFV